MPSVLGRAEEACHHLADEGRRREDRTGVNCPTATASSNCWSVSQPVRSTESLREASKT
jgi:hypothetical protein